MQKFILTIGREFGSRGQEIGKLIADHYNIPFYDKNDLEKIALNSGFIKSEELEHLNTIEKSGLSIKLWSASDRTLLKQMYNCQTEYIKIFAKKNNGVFIGRCADFILKDYPNVLSCFIYSPLGIRTNYLSQKYGLTPDATATMIQRIDQARHNYYKYFTKQNRGDRHNHHIIFDSSLLGPEHSALMLEYIINQKFS